MGRDRSVVGSRCRLEFVYVLAVYAQVKRKGKQNMITLTTPIVLTIAGVTETDTIGVLTSIYQDFQAMTQTAVYKLGTAIAGSPPALNQGAFAGTNGYLLTVILNMSTGVYTWTYVGNSGGGTVVSATLAGLVTQFITARNQAETFVSTGLLAGTITAWVAL
jgi:hypothetical protein